MQKGNVDDFRALWRLRAVDAEHTIVKLEILVDPKLPAPASIVTPELCTAAEKAVTGVRTHAEKNTSNASASHTQQDTPGPGAKEGAKDGATEAAKDGAKEKEEGS